jgi:putative membrane protein
MIAGTPGGEGLAMNPSPSGPKLFWRETFTLDGAATLRVLPTVLVFGWIGTMIYLVQQATPQTDISIETGPHEILGAFLGVLLVVRTNAGYERWWEARKLWGGIVNQSRNLVQAALVYGPADPGWRGRVVRWTAAFAHAARARLRGRPDVPELAALLGPEEAARAAAARHVPNLIALRLAGLLQEGRDREGLDGFGQLSVERQRAGLIDHLGGCERIRSTPLAAVYSIAIHHFVFLYLATLPFALLHKFRDADWLTPVLTALGAYAVLTLDQIGLELQQPFSAASLGCLSLDDICSNLERDLFALLEEAPAPGARDDGVHPGARAEFRPRDG